MSHDYRRRLLLAIQSGALRLQAGDLGDIRVVHDDDCAIFEGGTCACNPDVELTVIDADGHRQEFAIGPRGELVDKETVN